MLTVGKQLADVQAIVEQAITSGSAFTGFSKDVVDPILSILTRFGMGGDQNVALGYTNLFGKF